MPIMRIGTLIAPMGLVIDRLVKDLSQRRAIILGNFPLICFSEGINHVDDSLCS